MLKMLKMLKMLSMRFCELFLFVSASALFAQTQTRPVEGLRQNTPRVHALLNARIVQSAGRVIEKGTVVLRDGVIQAVGANISVPPDAREWDYNGLTVYPGLIDASSSIGVPKKTKDAQSEASKSKETQAQSTYWNELVRPENEVWTVFSPTKEALKNHRKLGFTAALVTPVAGIFRGAGSAVSLGDTENSQRLLKRDLAQHLAFARQSGSTPSYPTSFMGAIAVIRQTFLDADWYGKAHSAFRQNQAQSRPEENISLAKLNEARQRNSVFLFAVKNDQDALAALNLADEFGLQLWLQGSGYEYRILDKLKQARIPVILPVNFPKTPDVHTPEGALSTSLTELSHWEVAPANPRFLAEAGVQFALSPTGLKKLDEFPGAVRKAMKTGGLSRGGALKALTETPAQMFGLGKQLGSIDVGKLAHLVVTKGELFAADTKILDVWIDGRRYEIEKKPAVDLRGKWRLSLNLQKQDATKLELELSGSEKKLSGKVIRDTLEVKLQKVQLNLRRLRFMFDGKKIGMPGVVRLSARVQNKELSGQGQYPDGAWFSWNAVWFAADSSKLKKAKADSPKKEVVSIPVGSPPGAFANIKQPEQPAAVLVTGATIWTSGPQGILENSDLLIKRGKIVEIGSGLKAPSGAVVIDANGKHVTPGLIDAHSHSGLSRGVNEVGQAVTAEVRIGDARNSHDIAFYRELAGGLTVANSLHGSANPIGGQNQVIKLRWGAGAEDLIIKDAIPGIKFALGENVKQSNWGDKFTSRYPQTRMGVEQIIRDRFKATQDYERTWRNYRSLKRKNGVIPPRIDLELETLLEVLHGKRLVHSHSYRQDEILMLCRIAEDFGFTIGTFQHVLEGYKVAEVLRKHGAGASTFSDWWAYKFEVIDAIPYNGALMHDAGVLVSFNSDSNELARRMNLEAAKAVKYGGVGEAEALKFVTMNPAKQLRIDHRVGSLEAGKDADFVIWSGSPLSTYSKCEQTWIDGKKYFSLPADRELRERIEAERARLIQKVLAQDNETKK